MIRNIFLLMFFCCFYNLNATNQRPDNLEYEGFDLKLMTGWGHPSPLQTYYYKNKIKYPFKKISTANYRGHIASWKIQKNKFYLTKIEIRDSSYLPNKFCIKSITDTVNTETGVFADWFSGILECILYDSTDNYETIAIYMFQIRNGNIIDSKRIKYSDRNEYNNLKKMNFNYKAFYYRQDNELIKYDNEVCQLYVSWYRPSPIFSYYGENILSWPYNWENIEKSGAPNCTWIIENNKLFLTNFTLHYGLRFDTIYKDTIDINKEFPNKCHNNKLFAEWVNGIYLIEHGKMIKEESSNNMHFKTEKYTFAKFNKGEITESFTTNNNYFNEEVPDSLDENTKKLINEYYK